MRCQSCQAENRQDAAFCLECGARLLLACASCGRELPASARFCDGCGTPVSSAPATAAAGGRAGGPNYTPPPHLAAKILRERASIEGERRNVTVLFIDAVGSTSAAEKLDDEEFHRVTQRCTEKMVEAVNRFEGTVTQFRGDGIMAIFGAPIAHEDSARRAVSAGLAMLDALREYADDLQGKGRRSFAYRIGINTGPVIVGTIGADFSMDYTAVGDTVNLAARMEQWASPNGIYVTRNTQRAIAGYFELRDLGVLEVKGKAEGVQAYQVMRDLAARTRLDASVERGLTPYVGREEQLRELRRQFEQARGGEGRVVFVTGEAGMGKSRLLLEFRRLLGEEASWLEGRCISWGHNFPYLPVMEIVKQNFGVEDGDDDAEIARRTAARARDWGDGGAQAEPFVRYLLNVDAGDEVTAMDPVERRARVLDALRMMLMQESDRRPLVVVVEDLHWVDEQSEEALAAMIDAAASCSVLLIVTSRPGHVHALGDRTYFSRLVLRNLEPQHSASMVEGVLQAAGIPDDLQRLIIAKAEGNPFYIEEVSKSLLESGALRRRNGGFELARPADQIRIPDTVQEVILSRLDRLERSARDAVQRAAVIGREFPVSLLERVSEAGVAIDTLLAELKQMELIYEKAYFPELAYTFKHALTQEVALSTLLAERRQALHRTVAGAIEELYAERLSEHYESLAYHYSSGEDWQKALDYSKRVALRAESLHAPRAVIEYLSRAIDASQKLELPPDAMLHNARGRAHEAVGDFAGAREDHEAAIAAAAAAGDRRVEWRAYIDLGMLWAGRDYAHAGAYWQRAHAIARELEDERMIATSLNRLGNWSINSDHPIEALQHHDEALAIFQRLDDRRGIAETLDFMSMAHGLNGDMGRAFEGWIASSEIYRDLNDRQSLAGVLSSVGFTGPCAQTETVVPVDIRTVLPAGLTTEGYDICREMGWRAGEAYALMQRSMYRVAVGDYARGLVDAQEALAIAEDIGHKQWQAGGLAMLADFYADVLDWDTAYQCGMRSVELAREIGSPHWRGCSVGVVLRMAAERGDFDAADALLREELPPGTPAISLGQRSRWFGSAEIHMRRGEHRAAVEVYNMLGATARSTNGAGVQAIPHLAWRRGDALLAMGRIDAAEADFMSALKIAEHFEVSPLIWRVVASLGDLRLAQSREDDARALYARAIAIVDELAPGIEDVATRATFLAAPRVTQIRERAGAGAAAKPA